MFPPQSPVSIRPEVQHFITACEHMLIAIASTPDSHMSDDERRLIEYYRIEMAKALNGAATPVNAVSSSKRVEGNKAVSR